MEREDSSARRAAAQEEGESRARRSGFGRETSKETLRQDFAVVSNPG